MERPDTPKVPITCPDLDDLAELVKREVTDPVQRSRALALVEVIRDKNRQLRANAATWRKHALLCERVAGGASV